MDWTGLGWIGTTTARHLRHLDLGFFSFSVVSSKSTIILD